MADFDDEAIGAPERRQTRPIRRRNALLATAIAVVIVTVTIWLAFALTGSESDSGDRPEPPHETNSDSMVLPGRKYSDEDLGFEKVFQELIVPSHARFKSTSDRLEDRAERERYFLQEAVGHERERMYFEHNLASVYWSAYDELPAELGSGGILDQAFETAMNECAGARGWPGLTPDINTKADVDQAVEEFGMTHERFRELRHECAKEAASYPTLDPAVRDELFDRLREHYRRAVHDYLREFPEAEVPLVEHPGAPRPLEERLIDTCLKEPDPVQCAQEYRVELSAE
ncbi:hypothetical protein [Candidatus Poriferisodalis multihospitum]|uniref:hypothetical protein n=1 Tax=Candidatus Poriferisodalis multihospitum TaxID=2983191 RepID=UPI002B25D4FB|nr:hypothetical protein [Candidatus Poriferisodalis multihospitum]